MQVKLGRLFGAKERTGAAQAGAARVKDKVRLILGLPEDVAISVNEIVCADPGCPGLETIVLIMPPGQKTIAIKLGSAIEDLDDEMLVAGVRSIVQPSN